MAVGPVRTSILVPTFTSAHVFALSPVHASADAFLAHLRPPSNVPDASVTVFEMYALLAMSFEPTSKHSLQLPIWEVVSDGYFGSKILVSWLVRFLSQNHNQPNQ
jgi:hypothetical protein